MNVRRSASWGWILAAVVLLVVVAGLAYWLGATSGAPARPLFFGGGAGVGIIRLALLALVVAVLVGVVVAAITQQPTTSETYEAWHRRAHGWPDEPTDPPEPTDAAMSTAVDPAADAPAPTPTDETVT